MSTPIRLRLPRPLYLEMLAHAQAELPNECCGLLAGRITDNRNVPLRYLAARIAALSLNADDHAVAQRSFPLVNRLASPTEYDADPASLFKAVRAMRPDGLDILAFYHSHPTSAPLPSKKDLARNHWGDTVVHFIISLAGEKPVMRGWRLREDGYDAAEWDLTETV